MRIENYKTQEHKVIVATFDVIFQIQRFELTVRRCTEFRKGENHWISFPSEKFQTNEGETKYYPYFLVDKDHERQVKDKILELISKAKPAIPSDREIVDKMGEAPF